METKIRCDSCKSSYRMRVRMSSVGRKSQCPYCGEGNEIPPGNAMPVTLGVLGVGCALVVTMIAVLGRFIS